MGMLCKLKGGGALLLQGALNTKHQQLGITQDQIPGFLQSTLGQGELSLVVTVGEFEVASRAPHDQAAIKSAATKTSFPRKGILLAALCTLCVQRSLQVSPGLVPGDAEH